MIPLKDSNPTERFPVVTVLLITINSAVFLYELSLGGNRIEAFVSSFALVPARMFGGGGTPPGFLWSSMTIFTSMFLHGGLLHVAGNMLYLWIFEKNVEDAMGRFRFIIFYLLCGVMAAVSHAAMDQTNCADDRGIRGHIRRARRVFAPLP